MAISACGNRESRKLKLRCPRSSAILDLASRERRMYGGPSIWRAHVREVPLIAFFNWVNVQSLERDRYAFSLVLEDSGGEADTLGGHSFAIIFGRCIMLRRATSTRL